MMLYNDNKFYSSSAGSPLICDKNRRNLDFATIPYLPRALLNQQRGKVPAILFQLGLSSPSGLSCYSHFTSKFKAKSDVFNSRGVCILSSANLVIAKFLSQRLQELIHFPTALLPVQPNTIWEIRQLAVYYRDRRLNFTTFATSVKAVASQPHSGLSSLSVRPLHHPISEMLHFSRLCQKTCTYWTTS